MASYRNSKSFGERYEYRAISELLENGYDVYKTLVDDQGIDCVIRKDIDNSTKYIDLQIKARSRSAKDPATFSAMDIKNPRPNYAFMFYSEQLDEFWIIPSVELSSGLAYQNKSGKNKGRYRIDLAAKQGGKPIPKGNFDKYRGQNGLNMLERMFSII
jgi:hypothetical protein